MPEQKIIDRDTYWSIKKMSREELQGFLLRYADGLLKNDLYSSCHNNIVTEKTNDRGRNYRFENNNISAKVQTMRTTDIEFNRSEYKVDVNCAVILREYSDTEANSEKNIFFFTTDHISNSKST